MERAPEATEPHGTSSTLLQSDDEEDVFEMESGSMKPQDASALTGFLSDGESRKDTEDSLFRPRGVSWWATGNRDSTARLEDASGHQRFPSGPDSVQEIVAGDCVPLPETHDRLQQEPRSRADPSYLTSPQNTTATIEEEREKQKRSGPGLTKKEAIPQPEKHQTVPSECLTTSSSRQEEHLNYPSGLENEEELPNSKKPSKHQPFAFEVANEKYSIGAVEHPTVTTGETDLQEAKETVEGCDSAHGSGKVEMDTAPGEALREHSSETRELAEDLAVREVGTLKGDCVLSDACQSSYIASGTLGAGRDDDKSVCLETEERAAGENLESATAITEQSPGPTHGQDTGINGLVDDEDDPFFECDGVDRGDEANPDKQQHSNAIELMEDLSRDQDCSAPGDRQTDTSGSSETSKVSFNSVDADVGAARLPGATPIERNPRRSSLSNEEPTTSEIASCTLGQELRLHAEELGRLQAEIDKGVAREANLREDAEKMRRINAEERENLLRRLEEVSEDRAKANDEVKVLELSRIEQQNAVDAHAKIIESLREEVDFLQNQWESRELPVIDFSSEASFGKAMCDSLEARVSELNYALNETMRTLSEKSEKNLDMVQKIEQLGRDLADRESACNDLETKIKKFEDENVGLRDLNVESKRSVLECEQRLALKLAEMDVLKQEFVNVQKEKCRLESAMEQIREELEQMRVVSNRDRVELERLEVNAKDFNTVRRALDSQARQTLLSSSVDCRRLRAQLLLARGTNYLAAGKRMTGKPRSSVSETTVHKEELRDGSSWSLDDLSTFSDQALFDANDNLQEEPVEEVRCLLQRKESSISFNIEQVLRRHKSIAKKFCIADWKGYFKCFCSWIRSGSGDETSQRLMSRMQSLCKEVSPIEWGRLYLEIFRFWAMNDAHPDAFIESWRKTPNGWAQEPWFELDSSCSLDEIGRALDFAFSCGFRNLRLSSDLSSKEVLALARDRGFRTAVHFQGHKCEFSEDGTLQIPVHRILQNFHVRADYVLKQEVVDPKSHERSIYSDKHGNALVRLGRNHLVDVQVEGAHYQLFNSLGSDRNMSFNVASPDVFKASLEEIASLLRIGAFGVVLEDLDLWFERPSQRSLPVCGELLALVELYRIAFGGQFQKVAFIAAPRRAEPEQLLGCDLVLLKDDLSGISKLRNGDKRCKPSSNITFRRSRCCGNEEIDSLNLTASYALPGIPSVIFTQCIYSLQESLRKLNEARRSSEMLDKTKISWLRLRNKNVVAFVRSEKQWSNGPQLFLANLAGEQTDALLGAADAYVKLQAPSGRLEDSFILSSKNKPKLSVQDQAIALEMPPFAFTLARLIGASDETLLAEEATPYRSESSSHNSPVSSTVEPVLFKWTEGGSSVSIRGSFANWQSSYPMMKLRDSVKDFVAILFLSPGKQEFKFLVDGNWCCSSEIEQTALNNVMNVEKVESPAEVMAPWQNYFLRWCEEVRGMPSQVRGELRPTFLVWGGDGQNVCVCGGWDGWRDRVPMCRARGGEYWWTVVYLAEGLWPYRFVVDGVWVVAEEQPREEDGNGNESNVVLIG